MTDGSCKLMILPRFRLTASQKDDLAVVCELGGDRLAKIAQQLDAEGLTIRRTRVEAVLRAEAGDVNGGAIARLAFGIAGTFRRTSTTAEEFLEKITPSIRDAAVDDNRLKTWDESRAGFERLLSTDSVSLAAKALDISYDFERVYIVGRLLTSIRPVFDAPRDKIIGSTIVQTLRIEFVSPDGNQSSISIALDADDIKKLSVECKRALDKAEKAKTEMEQKFDFEAIIPGEEQ